MGVCGDWLAFEASLKLPLEELQILALWRSVTENEANAEVPKTVIPLVELKRHRWR